tara:strand:- start:425 stop:802 length:378 start_codon:yes stop_codon:yes gene_type:complete
METAGIIATVATGSIAIVAAIVKMLDRNGFFCECSCCGGECKIDGRKTETRLKELEMKTKAKACNTDCKETKRHSIFNYSNKRNIPEQKKIDTPPVVELDIQIEPLQSVTQQEKQEQQTKNTEKH